jgi:thiamine pyrophosphate-dependent acetolactate synthase large subunit-like protein
MKLKNFLLGYLQQAGIKKVFGVPGREMEYIRFNEASGIQYISAHLEFNAGLMADYLARITQQVQVCFCTLGPGATTALTPLASARLNYSPTIFIFAQIESDNIFYNLSHQCVDQVSISQPLAKWAYEIKTADEFPSVLNKAFSIALEEPVGPVVISIPMDLFDAEILPEQVITPLPNKAFFPSQNIDMSQIEKFYVLLKEAQLPLCLVGYETIRSHAEEELVAFCESWKIPIITSANAKGIISEKHPLNFGAVSPYMEGILGSTEIFNDLFAPVDLIITCGYQYVDDIYPSLWTRGVSKKVVHFSAFSPEPLKPRYTPDLVCLGRIQDSLKILKKYTVEPKSSRNINLHRDRLQHIYENSCSSHALTPIQIIKVINENLNDGIFVSDVGFFKHYSILFAKPQKAGQFITDAGLSSFGIGLGAAAAAQIAYPEKPIFLICGDGGFQAFSCDLSTLAQHNLPIVIILANSQSYELINRYQMKRVATGVKNEDIVSFAPINYTEIAKAYGCEAFRADSVALLQSYIQNNDFKKPLVIECPIVYQEYLNQE